MAGEAGPRILCGCRDRPGDSHDYVDVDVQVVIGLGMIMDTLGVGEKIDVRFHRLGVATNPEVCPYGCKQDNPARGRPGFDTIWGLDFHVISSCSKCKRSFARVCGGLLEFVIPRPPEPDPMEKVQIVQAVVGKLEYCTRKLCTHVEGECLTVGGFIDEVRRQLA